MGSSAQNSSGVHWCRRRVRFNRVPEGSEGSGEGLGGFGAEPSQVQQGSGEGSERFVKIKRCGCWGYHRSLFDVENGPWVKFRA